MESLGALALRAATKAGSRYLSGGIALALLSVNSLVDDFLV